MAAEQSAAVEVIAALISFLSAYGHLFPGQGYRESQGHTCAPIQNKAERLKDKESH